MAESIASLLQHLSTDELKELLNDDGPKIKEMIKDSPQIKALESERDILIASNKSLAEFNLSKEPSYRQARQALLDSHKEASDIKKAIDTKRDRLNELSCQTTLETTLALLQAAAAEAEEESDRFADGFLTGDIPLDSFLSSFMDKRKFAHMRRIKTEKLLEHVREQSRQRAFNDGPLRPAPPPPSMNSLPYPTAQTMPMPNFNQNTASNPFPFSNRHFGAPN